MSRRVRVAALSRMPPGRALVVVAASVLGFGGASCANDIRVLASKDSGAMAIVTTLDGSKPRCIPVACAGTRTWDDAQCMCVENFQPRCSPITCPTGSTQDPTSCSCVYVNCTRAPCDGGTWNASTCACESPTGACANGRTQYEGPYTGNNGSTLRLASMPQTPMIGDSQTWTMSITAPDGQPVPQGTSVSVACKMIHADFTHACASAIGVTRDGDTFTASPVIFNMQGDWQLTVEIGDLDVVTFGICAE